MFLLYYIEEFGGGKMVNCVFIKESYFQHNNNFVEMLDSNNIEDQTKRKYIFLNFRYGNNNLLVPLRTEMPDLSKIGQVGYMVPSQKKPNAGLDYRKTLIVNDINYLEIPTHSKIPPSQERIINANYSAIENGVIAYVDGYVKAAKKNRHLRDKKYRFSTLHNFHNELGITSSTN